MDDISIINKYILEQVKEKKMDSEMALRILKELSNKSQKSNRDIAVIGISGRFAESNNIKEYWNNILNRTCCIRDLPQQRRMDIDPLLNNPNKNSYFKAGFLDEIDKFDSAFFRISPREAMLMDPKQRIFLETVYQAIEDSGYAGNKIYGSNTGIFVGHDHSGDLKFSYDSLVKNADMIAMTGTYPGILASRTSYIFNLKGPSLVIDTACSSGLVSVHLACEALKNGECNMAIAGGVNLFLRPENIGTMNEIEAENAHISIFDKNAKGTAWGEGISAIILKPLNKAIEDRDNIYAVIKGSAINNDGASNGITAPNADAQEKLISRAWENAKISPDTISYIETHGTGTILGDPIEIKGITNAFKKYTDKKQFCGIGSVKPNIGHTVGASGMASLIKAVMALKEQVLPPSINFNEPNPLINFTTSPVYVNDRIRKWKKNETPRRAGVSSFGFSGTNCHIVLEEAPIIDEKIGQEQVMEVFTLSAKNKESLYNLIEKYTDFVIEETDLNLSNLCYTANTGRKHWEYRICLMVKDKEDLKRKIEKLRNVSLDFQNVIKLSYMEERKLKNIANQKIEYYKQSGKKDMTVLHEICELYKRGIDIDWESLYEGEERTKISMPVYAFLRERHWVNLHKKLPVQQKQNINIENRVEKICLNGRQDHQYSEIETMVGRVWGEALGINPINVTSDFYEMGGDSIIAIEIINRINKRMNINISVANLFEYPDIEKFSSYIKRHYKSSHTELNDYMAIPKVEEAEYYEVSSAQKRIFILNKLNHNSTSYNIPFFLMIEGQLDEKRLELAFRKLIKRHEVLRTSFGFVDEKLIQVIEENVHFHLERYSARETELEHVINNFVRPFNLEKAPLIRGGLVEVSSDKHLLMIDVQHIIADGASIPILQKELIYLYEDQSLPRLKIQFKDFAKWQNKLFETNDMKKQKEYWLNEFKGELPILDLPGDFSKGSDESDQGARLSFFAGKELTSKLNQFNLKEKVTLFMTLMASFNVLLFKHSGQEDIIIGSPIAGRKHKELENMIGMFVNTIALRNHPSAEKNFKELLEQVKDSALKAYENQDYPFEELVNALNIDRDLDRNALFNVMFVLQLMDNPTIEINKLKYTPYNYENKTAKFDLLLQAFPGQEDIKFEFTYSSKIFKRNTIEKFSQRFLMILESIVSQENILIGDINILDENEKKEITSHSNILIPSNRNNGTICDIFEKQAELMPNHVAVMGLDGTLTYRELNKKANQIARLLIKKGLQKEDVVGIIANRNTNFVAGIMGIIKAGAAYLPLDLNYPEKRIKYMLEDSGARMLLTESEKRNLVKHSIEELYLEDIDSESSDNLSDRVVPESLAYVIYTSGSTGYPKGVMIEHKSIVNLVNALDERIYNMHGSNLNVALLAPFAFDASVKQIFSALLLGHSLHIIPEDARQDVTKLAVYYKEHKIDISDGTPAYISLFSETLSYSDIGVKHFIIGGETLLIEEIKNFYNNFKLTKPPYITNVYGPTECCVDATTYMIDPEAIDFIKEISIGKPIKNCSIYILDEKKKLVPKGIVGEIYIGGEGVGRGYRNNEKLTDFKFIPDVFNPEVKMYKTGDLGKWTENGNIQFMGRSDRQVKIRGFRIELDEIKNRILSFQGVKEAVVIVRQDSIYAYVVCKDEDLLFHLKEYLKQYLPDYMIPSGIMAIEEIPITNNGKVDISVLSNFEKSINDETQYIAPRNHIEEIISTVWAEILNIPKIGIRDNFFVSGGDSIKAIKAANRMEKYNVKLEVKDIFQYQTIEGIASKIKDRNWVVDNSVVTSEAGLVPIQNWLMEHHKETLNHRNLSFILYRKEGFGEENIRKIFTKIIQHHDALRIMFKDKSGELVQINRGLEGELFDFHIIDVVDSSNINLEVKVNQIQSSMELGKGPLVKLALIKAMDGEHLLIIIHQMIIDHVSWRIILEDFNIAYTQLKNNKDIKLPNKTDSFLKWSKYLYKYADSEKLLREKEYWSKVESIHMLPIPTDFDSNLNRVKDNQLIYRQFGQQETKNAIKIIKANRNLKIESIFLTALGLTMKKWIGRDELVVNLGNHGRNYYGEDIDVFRTVGRLSVIYPVALQLVETENIGSSLNYVNDYLDNIPNKGIGHGILKYLSSNKSEMTFTLKPEISFNYMGEFDTDINTENFTVSSLPSGKDISNEEVWNYKLKFIALVRENKLNIRVEYNQKQYNRATIETLLDQYMENLNKVIKDIEIINA
ncbi:amino acid adenylation domain-containing protein [Bacillus sp. AF62]|uniref:type I polyketide synthase n=1 Tax=Bacillus sp. AF62 TaxID=3158960 RepID=UPI00398F1721